MNLSQIKREKMMAFLKKLKEENSGNEENLIAINEIENELNNKKYGLIWEEHEENVDKMMEENVPVFVEDKKREIKTNGDEYNFLLEGDNLHSLYLLEKTHKGKIDVIYIDPPYNTGSEDFKYDDKFIDIEDGFRHSKWCSFMYKRLSLAKELLSQNGFISISIDDNEYQVLRLLCDEIFGSRNYLTTFHIQVRYPDKSLNEEKIFKPLMEYVLFYAKDYQQIKIKQAEEDYGLEKFCYRITELSEGKKFSNGKQETVVFKPGEWKIEKIDGSLQGLKETWITGSIYTTMSYGKVFQTIVEPRIKIDGVGCLYKVLGRGEDGLGYRYYTGPQKLSAKKGKMFSGVPLDKVELFKMGKFPKRKLPVLTAYDFAADFGNIRHEGGVPFGSGKKPVKMLKQIINYSNNSDSVVLDFFAGSGSTSEAVLELNKEDGGNRHFILCTNNENNICEDVTYKRIKTVITGKRDDGSTYSDGIPANLKYYKTDFVKKDTKNLSRDLSKHVKELIQLENGVDIDNDKWVMILTEEDAEKFEKDIEKYKNFKGVYRARSVVWTKSQKVLLKGKEDHIIPDYYFNNELKEVGENW